MTRLRTTLTAALAVGALLATTAAGCGSDSSGGGRTVVVGGTGSVTCKQIPYNYALSSQDASGSGISISRGIIRGALWVTCGPSSPASFSITIVIKRNGIPVGKGSPYAGIPNTIGYEAWTIATCRPGVYRLQYTYRWTYNGGVQADTDTVATTETVTQHDCDA